jgi:hypothetical protein
VSEARCWRCERKLFEVEIAPGTAVPAGITVKKQCERCGATNAVPLDRLCAFALA